MRKIEKWTVKLPITQETVGEARLFKFAGELGAGALWVPSLELNVYLKCSSKSQLFVLVELSNSTRKFFKGAHIEHVESINSMNRTTRYNCTFIDVRNLEVVEMLAERRLFGIKESDNTLTRFHSPSFGDKELLETFNSDFWKPIPGFIMDKLRRKNV